MIRAKAVAFNEDWTETHASCDTCGSMSDARSWAERTSRLEYVSFVTVTDLLIGRVAVYKYGKAIN